MWHKRSNIRPGRTAIVSLLAGIVAVTAGAGTAAARSTGGNGLGFGTSLAVQFIGLFLVNGLIAGLLVAFGPRYAKQTVTEIQDEPDTAFGWGLLVLLGVPIALVLLAITIVGLVVSIPGLIVVGIVELVGTAVAVVWVGTLVTRHTGDRIGGKDAAVGALVLSALESIPILGVFVTAFVGFIGGGVVGRRLYRWWQD
ncbi:hypothetical protein [Natrinema caseinilyticum]|uniref:hypothetical protein n=1 Tax=Natrinema caseinilyticum TaxID=2961570 RepID=UPI0020C3EB99|nr:hypothetical protein [Natrinema caseinilyticum]